MDFVITDGKRYISTKGGIKSVASIRNATKMTKLKAENVLKSMPNTLKMFNWSVVSVADLIDKEDINVNPAIEQHMVEFKGLTDNILDKMLDVETYVSNLKKYLTVLDSELDRIYLEIIDIEHAAEFYDLDMYKGWKLYKMLQDARLRRRKYKDEKAKIEYILKSNFVDCTNNAITNYIKSMNNRQYSPRVLKELFNV